MVAHHIALVNVQAGVAAHVMDNRPDQAKQALAHVREASRSALDELRATVGLLRQSGEPEAPMEPAPGLAVLDQLLDGFRRAGLRVAVESVGASGRTRRFPPSVGLTAYRVIQESLTNVQKHAGAGAEAGRADHSGPGGAGGRRGRRRGSRGGRSAAAAGESGCCTPAARAGAGAASVAAAAGGRYAPVGRRAGRR